VLQDLAAKNKEKLNWRQSIVDLMKLLDLDSSLAARKEGKGAALHGSPRRFSRDGHLAAQAGHDKFAKNGGKVPADLNH
jgi:hypothetical protein